MFLHGFDHVRLADAGTVDRTLEAGRHIVHHTAGRHVDHDGPHLALEPALDDEDHSRIGAKRDAVLVDDEEPIGIRVLGEADIRVRATHARPALPGSPHPAPGLPARLRPHSR